MPDLAPWLGLVVSLCGIGGVLGAAYAVLKSNVSARTIELWVEQNAVLEVRLTEEKDARVEAEKQRAVDIARVAAAETHTAECEKRLTALERIVGDTMRSARAPRKRAT